MRNAARTPGDLVAQLPSTPQSRRTFYFFVCYFGIMHALPFWQMLTGRRPSVFLAVDVLGLYAAALGVGYLWRRLRRAKASITMLDGLVAAYILLALSSAVLYLQKDNPARFLAYWYGVHHVVLPSLAFFAVKRLEAREQAGVLRLLVALNLGFVGVGLLMYFWGPQFYTDFIIRSYGGDVTEPWQVYGRVMSYLGSTTVGIMAGLSLLLVDFYQVGIVARTGLSGTFAIGGLLCQQRGAYVAVGLGLMYQLLFRKGPVSKKILSLVALAVVLAAVLVTFDRRNAALGDRLDLIRYTTDRLAQGLLVADTMTERKAGYARGMDNVQRFPLGLGIGATLSASDSGGANPGGQVVDANYMRVLSDLGVLGLLLFCGILATAARRAWRSHPRFLWTAVVATYAIIGIGTNVFDSFYVSHVYWTLVGVIDAGSAVVRMKQAGGIATKPADVHPSNGGEGGIQRTHRPLLGARRSVSGRQG